MKINKVNGYAIKWLQHIEKDVDDIAGELKLDADDVRAFLEKNNSTKHDELAIKSSPVKKPRSKELMIRHTRDKKINNVAIMTREASEVNDEMKKTLNQQTNDKPKDYIFKPNN